MINLVGVAELVKTNARVQVSRRRSKNNVQSHIDNLSLTSSQVHIQHDDLG
jgi:hypothetical protein